MINLIAAMADNRAIGKDNQLLWHLPRDLKFFKKTTMGCPVIMGRKTFESVGKLLPGRQNIILSRNPGFQVKGAEVFAGLPEALERYGNREIFIAGGAQIYEQALDIADRIFLTEVHKNYEGDSFFPDFNRKDWEEVYRLNFPEANGNPALSFITFERIKK